MTDPRKEMWARDAEKIREAGDELLEAMIDLFGAEHTLVEEAETRIDSFYDMLIRWSEE